MKVLIVEDNEQKKDSIIRLLKNHPIVEDAREGLKMMYDLAYQNIKITTIVYSETEIYNEQVEYLKEIEYPFLGQAKSPESLEELIKNFCF